MRSGFLACWVVMVAVLGGLIGLGNGRALGQTIVGGVIDQDTTWTLAESPYIAAETVELIGGAVLTIEPGVEVAFEQGTALDSRLGVLIADGQGGAAIVLRSVSGEVGGWQGVFSSLDVRAVTTPEGAYVSGPMVRNVRIVEAVRGVEVGSRAIYLEETAIERCQESGVYYWGRQLEGTTWLKGVTFREAGLGFHFRGTIGDATRLVLRDCVFEDNADGGMLITEFARGELEAGTFRRNGIGGTQVIGGGAFLVGDWDIRACLFEHNESNDADLGGGGLALNLGRSSTIIDCDFLSNTSRRAGGGVEVRQMLSVPEGTFRVERCRFIENMSSESSGAGLFIEVPGRPFEVRVLDCTFEGNHGDLNGGLALLGVVRGEVAGNTFERNSALRSGGAVRFKSGSFTGVLVMRDNAFIENTTEAAGGAIDADSSLNGGLRLESNAFRGNMADTGGAIGGLSTTAETEIVDNVFENNSARLGGAVHVVFGPFPLATLAAEGDLRNRFSGNMADFGADIYNNARAAIDATGNCWGTQDLAAIAERIYDASDDPTKGVVSFDPIATDCDKCPADIDGDGELTIFDFLEFQNLFASGDLRADFDGDGELTFFDFLEFQNQFATGCD